MKIVYCQRQYLTLNKILLREKMDHEMRENTHSSNRSWIIIKSRKLKFPDSYVLDMGFSDDVKDRVTPHQYTIYFYNKTKEPISKIAIEVAENGDPLLNGEFHGRI